MERVPTHQIVEYYMRRVLEVHRLQLVPSQKPPSLTIL